MAAVAKYQKERAARDPAFCEKQKQLLAARKARYRADPEKRERELALNREWRKANWDRVKKYKHKSGALQVHHVAMRHAAKLRATPSWSEADDIANLYELARTLSLATGFEHHVDHIVPLKGRTVCGLHVLANLRVITAEQNKRKSNRLIEELATA